MTEKLFTIDLKDPSIAVITKYKFRDENKSSSDKLGAYLPYIVVLLAAGCVYYYRQQKNHSMSRVTPDILGLTDSKWFI